MPLVRLIYASTVSEGFSADDIADILEAAKKHNTENNVTGVLCFTRKIFLQCLEGTRETVNRTYHKILNDPRHDNVVILDYQEVVERQFAHWSMGYIPETSITGPINLKFSGSSDFDPYAMSGESVNRLILALMEAVPVHNG